MFKVLEATQKAMITTLRSEGVKITKAPKTTNPNRLVKGNSKLDKSILIFDLLAGSKGSCKFDCTSCYAKKAQNQYSATNIFRSVNFELAKNNIFTLYNIIRRQLKNSKQTVVRIHSSGDFFSQTYIDMWSNIISEFKHIQFYAYTKTESFFNFNHILENDNFNLIYSFAEIDGIRVLNYGDEELVKSLEDHGYFVCPATISKNNKVICGKDCKFCMTNDKVCFHIH